MLPTIREGGGSDASTCPPPVFALGRVILNQMSYSEAIDEMLTIKLFMAGTNEEIFTSKAWTNAFNIDETIYSELCHEFYSTYEFDEFAKRLELYNSEEIKEEGFDVYFQSGLRSNEHFNAQEYCTRSPVQDKTLSLISSGKSSSSGNLGSGRDTLTVGKISSSGNHITSSGNALAFYSQQSSSKLDTSSVCQVSKIK
ncbi:hypothetical protein Tco_0808271 [Tanacetum coccineum]